MTFRSQIKEMAAAQTARRAPDELPRSVRELTGYEPRPLQAEIQANLRRFNVLVCHRRFGKTVLWVNELIESAVECPFENGRYAYLAPTYAQAEDIAWTYLQDFTEGLPNVEIERSKLAVWVPTRLGSRARVRLYGVDSPKQRLRGMYLDGVVFDEHAQIPPSVWTEQVRPMLSDDVRAGTDVRGRTNQWAAFISTPMGRNHFHDLWRRAKIWGEGGAIEEEGSTTTSENEGIYRQDWYAGLWRASDTGILTRQELRDALRDMGQGRYDQEYECSFEAAVEGAIFQNEVRWLRENGRLTPLPVEPELLVDTGWDLGWDDATAIWFCQRVHGEYRLVDYYEATGADLAHYADILEMRGYRYGRHYFPHDVEVHELGSGKSRRSILGEYGIRVATVPKHRPWDGIEAARRLLRRSWIDDARCVRGVDALALYRREFNERLGTYREKPVHDWASHGADALRTLAMGVRMERPGGFRHKARAEL